MWKLLALFCLPVLLVSCSTQSSVSHSALGNVENSLTALEKSLPSNCKSEDIIERFKVIRGEMVTVREGIEAQLKAEQADTVRWRWAFWSLVIVIATFVVGRFFI